MQHLYAPWRDEYIKQKPSGCVFCKIYAYSDLDENFVFYKDEKCFGVMNLYPYTPGHIMFVPKSHVDCIVSLPQDDWLHISQLAQRAVKMLREGFGAQGVNLGMNLGVQAGAGIAEHVHLHLVPRFQRDTNFITSIANARVYPTDFHAVFEKIKLLAKDYLCS